MLDRCHKWMNDRIDIAVLLSAISRNIGTEQTLMLLTQTQWTAENDAATNGTLSIERLRLEVYEEIYWRLAGGRSREIMVLFNIAVADAVTKESNMPFRQSPSTHTPYSIVAFDQNGAERKDDPGRQQWPNEPARARRDVASCSDRYLSVFSHGWMGDLGSRRRTNTIDGSTPWPALVRHLADGIVL